MTSTGADEEHGDPFWSQVRGRHPDIDLVILPDEAPAAPLPNPDPSLVDSVPPAFDAWLVELWPVLVGQVECPPFTSHWTPGSVTDSLSRTALLAVDELDAVAASQALAAASRVLGDLGWHVFTPQDGMPRVLAGHDEGAARRELQIVHVPATGRFAVAATLGPLVVGRVAADAATEDAP